MGRILCVDFGTKRCGIATTDPLQIIVSGLETVPNEMLLDFLIDYCTREEVEKIVFGDPSLLDNSTSQLTQSIHKFASKLKMELKGIDIDYHDESFTSQSAKRVILMSGKKKMQRRDKSLVDKVSAVLILQDYLGHLEDLI